jgi:hypothetical protein
MFIRGPGFSQDMLFQVFDALKDPAVFWTFWKGAAKLVVDRI